MKRTLISALFVLLLVMALVSPVTASSTIKVLLNGKESPLGGTLIDDRTYVPLRWVAEQMGAFVEWKDGQVLISTGNYPVAADLVANLRVLGAGEFIQQGDISYKVDRVVFETKNNQQVASVTWIEEGNINTEFGAFPVFAYEAPGLDRPVKVMDYSVTVNPKFNNNIQRSLTYTFAIPSTLSTVIYFPHGSKDLTALPLAKWRTW